MRPIYRQGRVVLIAIGAIACAVTVVRADVVAHGQVQGPVASMTAMAHALDAPGSGATE